MTWCIGREEETTSTQTKCTIGLLHDPDVEKECAYSENRMADCGAFSFAKAMLDGVGAGLGWATGWAAISEEMPAIAAGCGWGFATMGAAAA